MKQCKIHKNHIKFNLNKLGSYIVKNILLIRSV